MAGSSFNSSWQPILARGCQLAAARPHLHLSRPAGPVVKCVQFGVRRAAQVTGGEAAVRGVAADHVAVALSGGEVLAEVDCRVQAAGDACALRRAADLRDWIPREQSATRGSQPPSPCMWLNRARTCVGHEHADVHSQPGHASRDCHAGARHAELRRKGRRCWDIWVTPITRQASQKAAHYMQQQRQRCSGGSCSLRGRLGSGSKQHRVKPPLRQHASVPAAGW